MLTIITAMKKYLDFMVWAMIAVLCISCETEDILDNEDDPEPATCNVVEVTENITIPTVWTEGNVYVINGKDITVRSVLTIEPGVRVKLKDTRIDVVGGKIVAKGTPQKRIVFTSLADDRYCGDTNGDGNATQPAKGDWISIYLNGTTETVFQYVDILYAGKNSGGSSNAVRISGPNSVSFTFDNCRIAHTLYTNSSYDSSCAFYGSSSMKDATVSKFTNNALYDNGKPIYFSAFYNLDKSNKFHNPEDPSQINTHNGIYLRFTGSASGSTVNWNNTEVPYVLDEWCQVFDPAVVNIGANVIVKFKSTSSGLQKSAPQNINMHETAILTSYKDDIGGDTNGDGDATSPVKGDWTGYYIALPGNRYYESGSHIRFAANP